MRCYDPKNISFPRYGALGVVVCERWRNFELFVADMGIRPAGMTLDRWPNRKGNYEPGNCRWSTPKQQVENSSIPIMIEFQGKTQCISDWAKELGIRQSLLSWRIRKGWPLGRALCANVRQRSRGEQQASPKLNDEAVRYIRSSPLSSRALGSMFRVSKSVILDVKHFVTWKQVSANP